MYSLDLNSNFNKYIKQTKLFNDKLTLFNFCKYLIDNEKAFVNNNIFEIISIINNYIHILASNDLIILRSKEIFMEKNNESDSNYTFYFKDYEIKISESKIELNDERIKLLENNLLTISKIKFLNVTKMKAKKIKKVINNEKFNKIDTTALNINLNIDKISNNEKKAEKIENFHLMSVNNFQMILNENKNDYELLNLDNYVLNETFFKRFSTFIKESCTEEIKEIYMNNLNHYDFISNSNSKYKFTIHKNHIECSCPAYFHSKGVVKNCKHCRSLREMMALFLMVLNRL